MKMPLTLTGERVVIAGDWHGDATAARLVIERAAALGIHTILHVGDAGIGPWPGERKSFIKLLDRYLERADSALLITPGNHENWDRLDAAPLDAAGMQVLGARVRALPRGHRFTIHGRAFGSVGGAVSIDADWRVEGRSWWPQELVLPEHVAALGAEPLDVFISHDAPAGVALTSAIRGIPQYLLDRADVVRELLAEAIVNTRPRLAFAGHWHQRCVQSLTLPDGSVTEVHVLSEEHTTGNAVVLDLSDMTVANLLGVWRKAISDPMHGGALR